MTREEAIQILDNERYFMPVESWHYEHNEALDMAIEALQAEQKYVADLVEETVNELLDSGDWRVAISNKHKPAEDIKKKQIEVGAVADGIVGYETIKKSAERYKTEPSDLISRADAICEVLVNDGIDNIVDRINELPSADAESKRVLQGYNKGANTIQTIRHEELQSIANTRKAVESADAVDCTDFVEWLVDRVLDETIWEYNSVAYGEIICRKLEKLGVLETTEEPSYYIRPSADAVQGEWQSSIDDFKICSVCGFNYCSDIAYEYFDVSRFDYCPSCGARMKGGDE